MRWPVVSARRYYRDLAAVGAERERSCDRQEAMREDLSAYRHTVSVMGKQLNAADGEVRRLRRQVEALTAADPVRRVLRLRAVGWRLLGAYAVERARADRLQARLDEACGLDDPRVLAGATWQETRTDRPKEARS